MARSYRVYREPAGRVVDHFGPESTVPAGYLVCDGSAVSRDTYARLFAVIGTTHGNGDGSTTFNLPDLRGRVVVGKDNMGGSDANRVTAAWAHIDGGSGGEEKHTPKESETASHNHSLGDTHDMAIPTVRSGNKDVVRSNERASMGGKSTYYVGGGNAFNVMQPGATCIKIIKT